MTSYYELNNSNSANINKLNEHYDNVDDTTKPYNTPDTNSPETNSPETNPSDTIPSDTIPQDTQSQYTQNTPSLLPTSGSIMYIIIFVYIACMILAGYLSWKCNNGESKGRRIINAFFASLGSFHYIINYIIIRYVMDWKCPNELLTMK